MANKAKTLTTIAAAIIAKKSLFSRPCLANKLEKRVGILIQKSQKGI